MNCDSLKEAGTAFDHAGEITSKPNPSVDAGFAETKFFFARRPTPRRPSAPVPSSFVDLCTAGAQALWRRYEVPQPNGARAEIMPSPFEQQSSTSYGQSAADRVAQTTSSKSAKSTRPGLAHFPGRSKREKVRSAGARAERWTSLPRGSPSNIARPVAACSGIEAA